MLWFYSPLNTITTFRKAVVIELLFSIERLKLSQWLLFAAGVIRSRCPRRGVIHRFCKLSYKSRPSLRNIEIVNNWFDEAEFKARRILWRQIRHSWFDSDVLFRDEGYLERWSSDFIKGPLWEGRLNDSRPPLAAAMIEETTSRWKRDLVKGVIISNTTR